ncbi:hypothetical protein PAGU2196_23140 [Pseudomonas sp. PAGU 2196]|uniref:primase-helicase family protein n=1 Tax=Pseudomonas sp. PAGU 2196 TaxID=2793997 RepID=UPI001EDD4C54|nr:primase-helicase family protein [Pseudomonas sp. PAGU 2196]GHS81480.1 hypothetical protein PAGU2196_23140 [Pseudomonas sp. PAGU 2196]
MTSISNGDAGASGIDKGFWAKAVAAGEAQKAEAAKKSRGAKPAAKKAAVQATVPGEEGVSVSSSTVLPDLPSVNRPEFAMPTDVGELQEVKSGFSRPAQESGADGGILLAPGAIRPSTPGERALLESMVHAQDDFKALPPEQREAHAKASGLTPDSYALLEDVSRDFVFVTSGRVSYAYERATGIEHGDKGFAQLVRKRYGYITPLDPEAKEQRMSLGKIWWEGEFPHKRVVSSIVMEPTSLTACQDAERRPEVLNLWHIRKLTMAAPDMNATCGDVAPLLEHLMYIADGDEVVVSFFLNWMAQLYQTPEIKIPSAILMYSKFGGVGKSMLYKLLAAVFGHSMVGNCSGRALTKSFDDVTEHKRVLVINEVARSEKADGYEHFKNMISEEDTSFEGKGRAAKDIKNITHFVVTTNNLDALPLMQGDRRVAAFMCNAQPKPADYYVKLHAWMEGPGPSLVAGVLARWTFPADWNPHAPVPQTDATRTLQDAAQGGLHELVKELVEDFRPPFDRDLIAVDSAVIQLNELYPTLSKAANRTSLGKVLKAICGEPEQLRIRRREDGSTPNVRVYLIRNARQWSLATPEQRGAHIADGSRMFPVQNQPEVASHD